MSEIPSCQKMFAEHAHKYIYISNKPQEAIGYDEYTVLKSPQPSDLLDLLLF